MAPRFACETKSDDLGGFVDNNGCSNSVDRVNLASWPAMRGVLEDRGRGSRGRPLGDGQASRREGCLDLDHLV